MSFESLNRYAKTLSLDFRFISAIFLTSAHSIPSVAYINKQKMNSNGSDIPASVGSAML